MDDVPQANAVAQHLQLQPSNRYLQSLYSCIAEHQYARAVASNDPFYGNYPPVGALPSMNNSRIPLLVMATKEVLSVQPRAMLRNCLVCGPTGGGKTNQQRLIVLGLLHAGTTVIVFDRKSDFCDCRTLSDREAPVVELKWQELKIALLQRPGGMDSSSFSSVMVEMVGRHLRLQASKRLLVETLDGVLRSAKEKGYTPTLSNWIGALQSRKWHGGSRKAGEYRESALFALESVKRAFGAVLDYADSNMLDVITKHRGCVVVRTSGLSDEMAALLASVFVNWAYESRATSNRQRDVVFVMDDALQLVHGRQGQEAEHGASPLNNWAVMGRARGIGVVVAAQNFSLVGSVLRNNSDTVICCGSYGRDAQELRYHLNLNSEQAAALPCLRPGEVVAVARSAWPRAVYGRVPEVP